MKLIFETTTNENFFESDHSSVTGGIQVLPVDTQNEIEIKLQGVGYSFLSPREAKLMASALLIYAEGCKDVKIEKNEA